MSATTPAERATRFIRPLRNPWTIDVLTEDELERVHAATLRVLERVGLQVRSESILRELAEAGAEVDEATMRVRFTPTMVEECMALAPPDFLMAARDPALDLPIDGSAGWLSGDGTSAFLVDDGTGLRRPSNLQDLIDTTRVVDAVPEVAYLWPTVAPADVPPHTQAVHITRVMLGQSTKHAQHNETYSRRDAQAVLEMARVVAGGDRELRERPIVSTYQCCISPLTYDKGPIEAAIEFARGGLPSGFISMGIGCATAPATLAGTLVSMNAEMVGGMVIVEALVPGAVTFCGPYPTFMDLRTGGYRQDWGPEDTLLKLSFTQLARRYHVPINVLTLDTGAKTQDWQAGVQHAVSQMAIAAAGRAEMITGTGTLHGAAVYDNANVILDAELWHVICDILEGIAADDEALALEAVAELAAGTDLSAHPHTQAHLPELWTPATFGHETLEAWEVAGRPDPRERAREEVRRILADHEPEPLPEDVDGELLRIIEARTTEV
jgi:trimethylamine:corrinoid methyltransferase-like protein